MLELLKPLATNLLLWLWAAAAVAAGWMSRGHRRRRAVAFALLALGWLVATRPVADLALRPLEASFPRPSIASLRHAGVRQVVVLTGGGYPVRGELLAGSLPQASTFRFLAGVELCARLGPDCRLIFSGTSGLGSGDLPTAAVMAELARRLEPGREIAADTASSRTAEHPGNVRPLVGGEPFALVTSAYHLPRAVASFHRAGLDPVPYPVDSLSQGRYRWNDWLPSPEALWALQLGVSEYLGRAYYALRGW